MPYNPLWPEWFEALKAALLDGCPDTFTRIEHVGSTAVPGLWAKPIIDLDAVIPSQSSFGNAKSALEKLGYTHQGDLGIAGREAFRTASGIHPHHLYLCAEGAAELLRHLGFRDRLRQDSDLCREYRDLKTTLAKEFRDDRTGYSEAKSPFILRVLASKPHISY